MANNLLAMIGAITLGVMGLGAVIALVVISAQGFYALFQWFCRGLKNG